MGEIDWGLNWIFNPIFCSWVDLCSIPCVYLGPNYRWRLQRQWWPFSKIPCMSCYTQDPRPCSRPPLTQTSTGDSWTLTSRSGSVSCGVTAPFSWVLVHKALSVLSKSLFPSALYYGGVNFLACDRIERGVYFTESVIALLVVSVLIL